VSHGSLWERWTRGARWIWVNEHYRGRLPEDFAVHVMTLHSSDRLHAKQGRSTARIAFRARVGQPPSAGNGQPRAAAPQSEGLACSTEASRPLAVYLKRHYRLPWARRWAALVHPAGRYSPAGAEWTHLERARALGIEVPEVIAAGEQIGPGARLQSFLMVAELTGCEPLHQALPELAERLDSRGFATMKRRLIPQLARIAATLHQAGLFHKDLYLCHFFLDVEGATRGGPVPRVVLIDLHRLGRHPLWVAWWRCKDLGQLLFSTYGVAGIDDRDRQRFWRCYRRITQPRGAGWQARLIRFRAARYARHNRNPR
jgi:heptose I phosphotransferase